MEKENIFGEQPINDDATSTTAVDSLNVSQDNQMGSPIGKFKDVESLYKSYNNLHSEFTKKCQALNELLKEKEQSDNVEKTPQFNQENWQNQVDEFLKNHPSAKNHTSKIANILASDKDVANSNNSLELAYSKILEDENNKLTSILKDENHILNSITPKIKDRIIKEYLKEVNYKTPFLINSQSGSNVVATYKKPMSVDEAGEMAKKLFK